MTPRVNFTAPGDDNRTEVWRVNTDFSGAETRKGTLRLRSGPGTKFVDSQPFSLVINTVTFDAGGGTGSIASQTVLEGTFITLPVNSFVRDDYNFSYRNRIDLAVNAKALGVVVHEDDRTENRPPK